MNSPWKRCGLDSINSCGVNRSPSSSASLAGTMSSSRMYQTVSENGVMKTLYPRRLPFSVSRKGTSPMTSSAVKKRSPGLPEGPSGPSPYPGCSWSPCCSECIRVMRTWSGWSAASWAVTAATTVLSAGDAGRRILESMFLMSGLHSRAGEMPRGNSGRAWGQPPEAGRDIHFRPFLAIRLINKCVPDTLVVLTHLFADILETSDEQRHTARLPLLTPQYCLKLLGRSSPRT